MRSCHALLLVAFLGRAAFAEDAQLLRFDATFDAQAVDLVLSDRAARVRVGTTLLPGLFALWSRTVEHEGQKSVDGVLWGRLDAAGVAEAALRSIAKGGAFRTE